MTARVLVVDNEPGAVDVAALLGDTVAEVATSRSGVEAVRLAVDAHSAGNEFDVILLEYFVPDLGGVDILRELRKQRVGSRMIIMSARDTGAVAVEAMRIGAFDFISKPLSKAELRLRVSRALRDRIGDVEPGDTGKFKRRPRKSDVIIGGGTFIRDLFERISMAAPTDVTVAITGESGTGKELVARTIHNLSKRFEDPFVVVNCAAIPENLLEDELFGHVKGAFTDANRDREGLFEQANGGSLFLDEIGEMPLSLQSKLLRVLQSQEFRRIGDDKDTKVDVRLITATNRDLAAAVKAGAFREDLFYRINVFPLELLPLRERRGDVPLLAHHFLLKHRGKVAKRIEGFTPQALAKMESYDFPGNVRELENTVHRALVLAQGESIAPDDVSVGDSEPDRGFSIDISRPFRELKKEMVDQFEREYARQLLLAHDGNIAAAARQAGVDRKNLWSLIKKHGIDVDAMRT